MRLERHKFKYVAAAVILVAGLFRTYFYMTPVAQAYSPVAGQSYDICDEQSQYLASPWSYHALASGSQNYTVAQYEALSGYGTTLPPLPSYISGESSMAEAAVIFAPGSTVAEPAYDFPNTPIIYFFEGGAYGQIGFDTASGDEFIGGSAVGYPEPTFDDGGNASGINGQNGSFDFSGGASTLAATANVGATSVTTTVAIPGYLQWVTFADGSTYSIANASGTTITLNNPLANSESTGGSVWANVNQPIGSVSVGAAQGATTVTVAGSSLPLLQYGVIRIGDHAYTMSSVSGNQSSYTVGVQGLDIAADANTPVYYDGLSGDVTVSYLDINNDQHVTTGTIYTGADWTITHNDIHDGNSNGPGYGVAIYGGDQGTIEYNCLSKMGDYGVNVFGTNNKFDYNEVYESNYNPDPGCGCSGGGKWWGTLNADIVDNAFINDSPGGGGPVWLDNGNSGTLIQGNYFDMSYGSAIASETGFDLDVTGNLFLNGGWGDGTGACGGDNCDGAVNINSSGGFNVPSSRYENEVLVSSNQFVNNWMGIDVWQSGSRSCENSGEGWPDDAPYCSGGYPNSASTSAGGQFYFSHITDNNRGGTTEVAGNTSSGSSTVLVQGSEAINDQIGFADPLSTTTASTNDVTTLSGSQSINAASTTGFPSSGDLRVGTSAAWSDGDGSWTGAVLSYTGTTANSFTGVSLVRGTGTLSGPILQVQPYKVTAETCYANDCAVSITPSLSSNESVGTEVSNAGTCQLYATAAALPSGPLAPNGVSYWDGCQWGAQDISVTDNDFVFQPSVIANSAPLVGGGTTTSCTASNTDFCGVNFMANQVGGEAPFDSQISANAMMSSSSYSGCPGWDSGCTSDPLANLNALSNPPGVPVGNGEAPGNDVWSDNTYNGPWSWYAYIFGNCAGGGLVMPSDPVTSKSLTPSSCNVDFPTWQADWQQDAGSSYNSSGAKAGDLNNDGQVNIFDLSILLSSWGTTNSAIEANLNRSGPVDIFDLSIFLSSWGT